MTGLFDLRDEERRDTLVGFLVLFGVMASHALLETARDTLFLSRLDATNLPWAYLMIAVLAFGVAKINQELLRSFLDKRRVLALSLVFAGAATFGFWAFLYRSHTTAAYALYVWTGLVATMVVVQFWLLVEDVVTITQAKRTFGYIAAGGVFGATVGSLVADRLVDIITARHLLLVAAGLLLATGAAPLVWSRRKLGGEPRSPRHGRARSYTFREMCGEPYLRRLIGLVVVSMAAVTAGDFLFKSVVQRELPAEELGSFFARFYLLINGVALVVQVFFSSWLFRAFGVSRTLFLLPTVFLVAVGGFAFVPGLLAASLLKGADGSLRHSVHRTGLEVLYLPLPRDVRERFKELIDAVGSRGGQALASLGILAALYVGATPLHIAMGIGVLTAGWFGLVVGVKRHYVNLFRHNLREGTIETKIDLAQLDLHSLEALVSALNSEHDEEVLAALELFERHERTNLVPVLILYHPSRQVVLRALDLFAADRREDFLSVARRLLRESSDEVRAAALRAITAVEPDEELLLKALEDDSPHVYATALVGLQSRGIGDSDRLEAAIDHVIREGSTEAKRALAAAVRHQRDPRLAQQLMRLAREDDISVKREVARAMAALKDDRFLSHLVRMLAHGRLRSTAREAILAIGPTALAYLEQALADESMPRNIRRHLPRTISRFEPAWATNVLLSRLPEEHDGAVRYKILRGLGRLREDHPEIKLDRKLLRRMVRETLERAVQFLDWRVATTQAHDEDPSRHTPGGEMLVAVLREKEEMALERIFRLLGLLHVGEDFHLLWQGLHADDPKVRAASREVLSHVVSGEVREALMALMDDATPEQRLTRGTAALGASPTRPDYEARLVAMLQDESEAVRCVVAHHIGELGLSRLAGALEQARPTSQGFLTEVIERSLSVLDPNRTTEVPHVA